MSDVYGLTPINGTAAMVTNQKGCADKLTPKQERENLISHVKQVESLLLTFPKGSKERSRLGLKKLEFCSEISKLNEKMGSDFQYKQIMRLSREMRSNDLKIKG